MHVKHKNWHFFYLNLKLSIFSLTYKPYIHDFHMEVGERGFEICHVSVDSNVIKQKIYSSFLHMRVGRLQNWSFFVDVINVWLLTSQTCLFISLRVAQWYYGIWVRKLLKVCNRSIFSKFGITNVSDIELCIKIWPELGYSCLHVLHFENK